MYVITSPGTGHCVINGLGEVKVFATAEGAQRQLDRMREDEVFVETSRLSKTYGFEVRKVHYVEGR